MIDTRVRNLSSLLATLQGLKRVPRTGWIDRGVPISEVESVADHSFLTALLAWLTALEDPQLDATRVLKLAVIHDLAESLVGDEPPYAAGDVPDPADREALRQFFSRRHVRTAENKAAKQLAEQQAFTRLAALMGPSARSELVALWEEYEAQATPEARFVKQADTLEAYLQSRHYAAMDPEIPLGGFSKMADQELDIPAFTALRDAAREG
jgi:putative hydrolases of HD superfamily